MHPWLKSELCQVTNLGNIKENLHMQVLTNPRLYFNACIVDWIKMRWCSHENLSILYTCVITNFNRVLIKFNLPSLLLNIFSCSLQIICTTQTYFLCFKRKSCFVRFFLKDVQTRRFSVLLENTRIPIVSESFSNSSLLSSSTITTIFSSSNYDFHY